MTGNRKTLIIGAGPVGALAALYAAQRGHDVEIYELRSDLRDPTTTPLNFTKSINLALSERGINSMRESGRSALLQKVLSDTIPMRGRMIHGKDISGILYEEPQDYDAHGRTIFAVDRAGLNKHLLDELETMPNVKFFFNHKMVGADFRKQKAWFEVQDKKQDAGETKKEIEVEFDLLIGADGAHSAARYHMMKFTRMDYQQEYIDALWCEFTIAPKNSAASEDEKFAISPHHLHIWPGEEHMFIAIPSSDGSFTCTLFMPSSQYALLEQNPEEVPNFFNSNFPGVTALISPTDLIASFKQNPHLPLISIRCAPHHGGNAGVIIGDAAHAMYPFYGQGMNAGLEDVRVLFSILDKYPVIQQGEALVEYSQWRTPDAHAIIELAAQNYIEMRASVVSPVYKLRKWLEELLSVHVPSLGWKTKYSRVSFGNERYSEVIQKSDRQGKLLLRGLIGVVASPLVIGAVFAAYRWKKTWRGLVPGWLFG